jgi:hypothetical protein
VHGAFWQPRRFGVHAQPSAMAVLRSVVRVRSANRCLRARVDHRKHEVRDPEWMAVLARR